MRKLSSLLLFLVACAAGVRAQSDSTGILRDSVFVEAPAAAQDGVPDVEGVRDWRLHHPPGRAALYSALLPGAGQVYNRKYWKVPIVWAGLGVSYYFIRENTTEYNRYKNAYLAVIDGDPNTVDEFNGTVSSSSLLRQSEQYRRWLEWSYIALGAVYILNVMDAAVDAYFVRFDVSPDLSLGLGPSLQLAARGVPGVSVVVGL